jgi:putative membrane protein
MTRKPAAYRLDDPNVRLAPAEAETDRPSRHLRRPAPEYVPSVPPDVFVGRRRLPFALLFWSAFGALAALALGFAGMQLIEQFFARATWLGLLGTVLAGLAALALVALLTRETLGLLRLRTIEHLKQRAETALADDDRVVAGAVVRELLLLTRSEPRLARPRAGLAGHLHEIIDGADLVRLAERELLRPLDDEARRRVSAAATRVSLVTAISPRAAVDMAVVVINALVLVRSLAELYGGRPGVLGLVRLLRHVISHVAVTGGLAAGDSLIQQVLGHGVAAKVSARLGEGVLNGLLTARLGLAAIEVARPLPFAALPRPVLADLVGDLLSRRKEAAVVAEASSSDRE